LRRLVSLVAAALVAAACAAGPSSGSSAGPSPSSAAGQPSASAATTSFKLLKPGVLTVATDVSYPPWFIIVPGALGAPDTATGVDGDLVYAFAAEQGLKVELLETDFASSLLAIQQGKADMTVGFSYGSDRSKVIYYTAAVGSSPLAAYTLKSLNYAGPDSLKGKRLGTGNGYFEAAILQQWGQGSVQLFPNNVTGNQALLNGQIDAWFSDVTSLDNEPFKSNLDKVVANTLKGGDFGFTEQQILSPVYNGVACGNGALAIAFDATLQRLHDNGGWTTILSKYLSGPSLLDLGVNVPPEGCAP
jgi:ABC-type amino acid transport substrate-binding protein